MNRAAGTDAKLICLSTLMTTTMDGISSLTEMLKEEGGTASRCWWVETRFPGPSPTGSARTRRQRGECGTGRHRRYGNDLVSTTSPLAEAMGVRMEFFRRGRPPDRRPADPVTLRPREDRGAGLPEGRQAPRLPGGSRARRRRGGAGGTRRATFETGPSGPCEPGTLRGASCFTWRGEWPIMT